MSGRKRADDEDYDTLMENLEERSGPSWGCMDDCIHLHACRRVQAIGRKLRLMVPRYCSEECRAYQSRDEETEYVSIREALAYAMSGVSSIRGGYDPYDVYAPQDLCGHTIGDIMEATFDE